MSIKAIQTQNQFKTKYALVLDDTGLDKWFVNIKGGWLVEVENVFGVFQGIASQHWRRLAYTAYKKRKELRNRIIYGNAQNITAYLDKGSRDRLIFEENERRKARHLKGKNFLHRLFLKAFDLFPYMTEEEENELIKKAIIYHLKARREIWRTNEPLEDYMKRNPFFWC